MKLMQYVKKLLMEKGAEDAIVVFTETKNSQIKFANSRISAITNWTSADMSLFAAINKRIITTALSELTEKAAEETVSKTIRIARMLPPNKEYEGIAKGPFKYKKIQGLYDKEIEEADGIELVAEAIQTAKENRAKRSAGVIELAAAKSQIITSGGVETEKKETGLHFSIRSFAEKDASGHDVFDSRKMGKKGIVEAAKNSAELAVKALNPKEIKQGKFDVIFTPLSAANLLECLGTAASAFYIDSGLSCLKGMTGKKVASEKVNLSDNPTIPFGIGSQLYDAEGVPTQETRIIENGVLKTYLHNTSTAKRYKTKTTANAGLIVPQPFNLILEKGRKSQEEMTKEIDNGLIITNVWYTRFQNYATGQFSTIPRDAIFLIKNGEIACPVKGVRVSDNLLNIMRNITELGKESKTLTSWDTETPVTTPPILVKNVNITKSIE